MHEKKMPQNDFYIWKSRVILEQKQEFIFTHDRQDGKGLILFTIF